MVRPVVLLLLLAAGLAIATPGRAATQADLDATASALTAVDRGRHDEARRVATAIHDPLARKIVNWRLFTRQRSGADFDAITAFVRANPDWPRTSRLLVNVEEAMPRDLPPSEVVAWFDEFPPRSLEGHERRVAALAELGRIDEAKALARRLWASDNVPAQDQQRFHERFGQWLRPEDHYARVDTFLWKLHANTAAAQIETYPLPDGAKPLLKARAALLRGSGPGLGAAQSLLAAIDESRRHDPGLLYAEARWHRVNDRNARAHKVLAGAPADPAHAGLWWRERHILTRRALFDEGDPRTAYALARDHRVPEGANFVEAEWTAGWIALRFLDDPETAFSHFNRVFASSGTPISVSRGAYWLARAAEAMDNSDWATNWYTEAARYGTAFYGQAAAAKLPDPSIALEAPPRIDHDTRTDLGSHELTRAARLSAAAGQDDLTFQFLTSLRIASDSAAELQVVADIALELGQPSVAVRAGKDAARRGVILVSAAFPDVPVAELDLDRAVVRGLIRQESEFNATAVSPAGARGLMQLMPGTAERVARSLGLAYSRGRLTSDPQYNVRLGAAYLRQMLDRYDSMAPLALAAYNAGPHRVDRWIDTYGDPRDPAVDIFDWIEAIPYGETRNYVQRVLESMQIYRTLAGDMSVAAIDPRTHWRIGPAATAEADTCPAADANGAVC